MAKQLATIVDTNFMTLKVGAVPFSGFAEGDAVSHTFPNDDWAESQGTDGAATFVRQHNNISSVVARTVQGNQLNALLTELHKQSLRAGGIFYPFFFADLKGDLKVTAAQSMIVKHPDWAYADSAKPWDWGIKVVNPDIVGGAGLVAPIA